MATPICSISWSSSPGSRAGQEADGQLGTVWLSTEPRAAWWGEAQILHCPVWRAGWASPACMASQLHHWPAATALWLCTWAAVRDTASCPNLIQTSVQPSFIQVHAHKIKFLSHHCCNQRLQMPSHSQQPTDIHTGPCAATGPHLSSHSSDCTTVDKSAQLLPKPGTDILAHHKMDLKELHDDTRITNCPQDIVKSSKHCSSQNQNHTWTVSFPSINMWKAFLAALFITRMSYFILTHTACSWHSLPCTVACSVYCSTVILCHILSFVVPLYA